MSYFPMFVELSGRKCLVIGGGRVAYRKAKVLKDFGAEITVAAPEILYAIREIPGIKVMKEGWEYILGTEEWALVVAATDDWQVNHMVSEACRRRKIPVNAVDQADDCTFIFPSYIKQGEVTGAFTSGGSSPVVTQYLKEQMKGYLTEFIGEIAEYLGGIREEVKREIAPEDRKKLYRRLLCLALEEERIPTEEEKEGILTFYKMKSEGN